MKETFILSNLNEYELLRTLALKDRVSFNTHILNASDLAEEILLRNGNILEGEMIDSFKQECIIFNNISNFEYFKSSNFNDCKNIVSALNSARMLCRGNEEEKLEEVFSKGEFPLKNKSLLEIYKTYKNYLKENNLYDSVDLINEVIKNKYTIDAEFIYFKEDRLKPLEEELLKTVSLNNIKEISLSDFLADGFKLFKKCAYDNSYGAVNEVENIIGYISENNLKYDDVLIVLNDPTYFNHFLNISNLYSMPVSFSDGYPLSSFNAASIFNLLVKWDKEYNSFNPLMNLINAAEFNSDLFFENASDHKLSEREKAEVLKAVGSLRLSTDKKLNEEIIENYKESNADKRLIKTVSNISLEFNQGYSYLIRTYTKIRKEQFKEDVKAVETVCGIIDEYQSSIKDFSIADVKDIIFSKKILREKTKPGAIAICSLKDALSINRKHIFLTGLNARVFPGSPKENYLLLDSDLELFKEKNVPSSLNVIKDKRDLLFNVVELANALESEIHISYSGYSLTDLKEENPSSMIFEIFKKERGVQASLKDLEEAMGRQHTYFEQLISNNREIGRNYIDGIDITPKTPLNDILKEYESIKEISPSAAEKFFECPKKYYLKYILGIDEPEDDDPFVLLPGAALGTLTHECMEDFGNNPAWSLEDFLVNANEKFDNYIKQRRTVETVNYPKIKNDFLEIVTYGYKSDPRNSVFASELKLGPLKHESGLIFGGRCDRVEINKEGEYIIVDYKTNSKIKHIDEDIDTCFQAVLYSWLLSEQKGFKVTKGEYRYLKLPGTYTVTYNDVIKNKMDEKIHQMKEAFDTGVFACNESDDNCRYCKYADICGKDEIIKEEVEED